MTFTRLVKAEWKSDLATDLYRLVRHEMLLGIKSSLLAALPNTLEKAVDILSTKRGDLSKTAYGTVPNVIRELSWLQEHGMCLDHIRPGMSQVCPEQHGAFAARYLPAGTVVAPAPLIHLHRGHLDMFINDPNDDNDILWRGHQLFLNYVYGHPSTSVVLFPYSPVVNLINHGGKAHANVKVRWSASMTKSEWLNITTEELLAITDASGLMMEFIALRDIEEGEEVLIDYGDAWQEAWNQHVEQWKAPLNSEQYVSAWMLNQAEKQIKVAPQPSDWQYPSWIFTVCWVNNVQKPSADDSKWYIWDETSTNDLVEARPCRAVRHEHEDGRGLYHVVLLDAFDWDHPQVKRVPRHAIAFAEQRYTGHQALRQSFRHVITLPDELIPETWKDFNKGNSVCSLYLAESSIPNAGFGVYTGKDVLESQAISYGEIVIQVEDPIDNARLRRLHTNQSHDERTWLVEDYFWESQNTMGSAEANQVESLVPGIGTLSNSHTGLVNARMRPPKNTANEFNRFTDPEAGASTNYHNVFFEAKQDVLAGTELFVPYGDLWFNERQETLGIIPLSYDYEEADKILSRFVSIFGRDGKSEAAKDFWLLLSEALFIGKGDRIHAALPKNFDDITRALDTGTARYSLPDQRRSLDWLAENGRCLDNIRPGKSQIPQAGQGAFASRHVSNGAVITTSPVVHFKRTALEIFKSKDMNQVMTETWYEGMQLMWNYCYGHPQSSLVLFPYSPTVNYINHGGDYHNAILQWSTLPNHRSDWFDRSPNELVETEAHAGLILEVVATRDISPGEEILLDYGENWATAWAYHAENWRPREQDSSYKPASVFNDITKSVRTLDEQKYNPYPDNIYTACWVSTYETPEESIRGVMFEWQYTKEIYDRSDNAIRCDILERYEQFADLKDSVSMHQDFYEVLVHQSVNKKILLRNVPRRAIQFFDVKYTSDQSLRSAFRHEIGFPERLVPDAWRDMSEDEFAALYSNWAF